MLFVLQSCGIHSAVFQQFFGINILSYACSYLLRFLHCQYDGCGTVYYIAAAENAGAGSHAVGTVAGDDKALLINLNTLGGRNNACCRFLAYCENYAVAGDKLLTAFCDKLTIFCFSDVLQQ